MSPDADPEAERRELRELVEDLRARVAALEERTKPDEVDPLVIGTELFREASRAKRKATKGV